MTNKNVSDSLKVALADSYVLYLKTQNYHWNVTGPNFKSFHLMFEEQYNDLFTAVDLIAERIRAIGEKAPGTYAKYIELTNLKEGNEDLDATSMVRELAEDQDAIVKTLTNVLKESQNVSDEVTAGIVTDRIEIHQKNAWMLKSSL
ncbi:MAG: DNA starvation/stationary phase protection protein [Alphaproteobacteria bacterium]|jgi:starvation-inducible DNA-binding protein|nr:DNA starvation/stationary phase protection protein [Alphaproteobacteria bacterium]